jgi:GntR family transcriptional regulator/MocR family aminotransferase
MKKLYARRREAMLGALASAFGADARVMGEAAGLHVAVAFGGPSFRGLRLDEKAVSRIASAGALVYPASRFAFAPFPGIERVLLLGYGNLDEERIGEGVGILASCLGAR